MYLKKAEYGQKRTARHIMEKKTIVIPEDVRQIED